MDSDVTFSWQDSLSQTYQVFAEKIIAYSPQLIGALTLLLLGWVLALILRYATKKIVIGFDSIFQRLAKSGAVKHDVIKRSYADVAGKSVFWIVIVFFVASATNLLGWDMFSAWVAGIINYLPNLLAGVFIIVAGFLISNITKTGIVNTANSSGIKQGPILARIAQVVIIFTALLVGIEQIGVNVDFLTNVLIVILAVLLGGCTLAFSFGAKTLVENVIGAQYVKKHCRIGEKMKIANVEGNIVELTQTAIILDSGEERLIIPAKYFQEQASHLASVKPETTVKG